MLDPGSLEIAAIAAIVVVVILSLSLHEVAHGWVALKRGDTTARDLGRLTLNPVVHIDPVMTILVPVVLLIATSGNFVFGGAKPVPVNFYNLRHPHRDMALVALAGPISNFLIAILLVAVWKVTSEELGIWTENSLGYKVLHAGVTLNLLLAIFNLVPIPPLDGSRVMTWILPTSLRDSYAGLERFGILLVLLLLWIPGLGFQGFLQDSLNRLYGFALWIVTLGGAW